jgi:hypothetical protein
MNLGTQIGLGVGIPLLFLIIFFLIFFLRKRRKDQHPIQIRAKEMMVMITQRIHTLNRIIQKNDNDISKLLLAQEKEDPSIIKLNIPLDEIPERIESIKQNINESMADIKDLKEYRDEIDKLISIKGEKDWEKIEEFLDFAREKMQYRFT